MCARNWSNTIHCTYIDQDEGSGQMFKDDAICQAFLKGPVSQLDNTVQASTITPRLESVFSRCTRSAPIVKFSSTVNMYCVGTYGKSKVVYS